MWRNCDKSEGYGTPRAKKVGPSGTSYTPVTDVYDDNRIIFAPSWQTLIIARKGGNCDELQFEGSMMAHPKCYKSSKSICQRSRSQRDTKYLRHKTL